MFFFWNFDANSGEKPAAGPEESGRDDTRNAPQSTTPPTTGFPSALSARSFTSFSATSSPKRPHVARSAHGTPKQMSLTDEELGGTLSSPDMTPSTSSRALGLLGHQGIGNSSMRSRLLDFHFTSHIKASIGKDGARIPGSSTGSPLLQKAQSLDIESYGGRYSPGPVTSSLSETHLASDDLETGSGSEKLGRIQFSVAYDFQESTLTLRIIRAVDLPAKDFTGTSDPYVRIMLLPDKKRKLTTNIKRKNLNPRWNEVFAFEDATVGYDDRQDILLTGRGRYINFCRQVEQVLDYDRFSRDDPIGEVCVPLSDLDLASGHTLWKNLQPCKGHTGKLGELHVGLCYQPTVGRITVIIHRARELKAKDINGLSDPYVKVWLYHDGKKVEKKKTAVVDKTLNPIFNESFVFDVPYERIRQTSLIVSVMDYDRMGRNERIGQIVLGSKSGPMEVRHWNEMFSKTRQAVSQWHILKDFG